tara:strand:- start:570 stop:857 length:288 start_codon:yes stop_codon:yes gene_type:complete
MSRKEILLDKPYNDVKVEGGFVRTFNEDVKEDSLIWHRDLKNRKIEVLECRGWKFQRDNQLPIELKENEIYEVNAMEYHRLIKGNGRLKLRIKEL